ncbi:MAG: T9SS type A sorting domain-containing protein, partial [candidate division Zixibacteria bacterium]|nr:T9SS type A sorting domain-containing protein [candidate division Zixibacteria bacterium]
YSFNTSNGGYETTIADDCGKVGMATVWAKDNSSANFFINTDYICYEPDTTLDHYKVVASDGRMELIYKNVSTGAKSAVSSLNGIEKIAILTSPYPILSNGLGENFTQAGNTYSVATYPVDLPDEGTLITIRYAESDLIIGNDQMGIESSLSIHQWNVGNDSWEPIGGTVDTALNEVFTIISDAGIYAAFTTDIMTGIGDDEHGSIIPDQFQLSQNYPNPFNPTTMIEYNVPTRSDVSIEIFNIVGQKIRSLVNETKMAGKYEVIWDGDDSKGDRVSSGIYFYRFETDNHIETKKMLLLK